MTDDQVGPSGRYIIDTCIIAPEAGTYAAQAALTAGAAAAQAYARKYATYTPHKLVGDVILPVVCEAKPGARSVHPAVLKRLACGCGPSSCGSCTRGRGWRRGTRSCAT